jgi:hypothetical protein
MPLCLVAEKEAKQTGGVMKLLREPSQCKKCNLENLKNKNRKHETIPQCVHLVLIVQHKKR